MEQAQRIVIEGHSGAQAFDVYDGDMCLTIKNTLPKAIAFAEGYLGDGDKVKEIEILLKLKPCPWTFGTADSEVMGAYRDGEKERKKYKQKF
jgi:hypothetical protein